MTDDLRSSRTELQRYPSRGEHDFDTVAAILDATFVCHVGFNLNGQPYVIPTSFGRNGHMLYVHGSQFSRMLGELKQGVPACVTVTLVDGLVLARSGFHSSVNYRSAVVLGTMEVVAAADKLAALRTISEHILPGRWACLRPVQQSELDQTIVLGMQIVEASAKLRTGPPADDEADYGFPVWAGVLPLADLAEAAIADPRLSAGIELPEHVQRVQGRRLDGRLKDGN